MTKASLTERQAITSTPLLLISEASCLKPGRCLAEQVGVNAPGSANSATFLPPKNSSVVTGLGPSAVARVRVTLGSLSPTLMVMDPFLWMGEREIASSPRTASVPAQTPLESVTLEVKCRGHGRWFLLRSALDRHAGNLGSPVRARPDPDLRPRRRARHGPGAEPPGGGPDRAGPAGQAGDQLDHRPAAGPGSRGRTCRAGARLRAAFHRL